MDPNATLKELLIALAENNLDDAAEHASNLAYWISRGGFPPTGWKKASTLTLCHSVRCRVAEAKNEKVWVYGVA